MKIGALYPSPEGKGFTANRDNYPITKFAKDKKMNELSNC